MCGRTDACAHARSANGDPVANKYPNVHAQPAPDSHLHINPCSDGNHIANGNRHADGRRIPYKGRTSIAGCRRGG